MFIRKGQQFFILIILCLPFPVEACAVCFGGSESNLVKGSVVGGIVLMSITTLVLSFFAYLIVYLRKKSNLYTKIKMNGKRFS
jgi:hypothetical protein